MSLVKTLIGFFFILVVAAFYGLHLGSNSKQSYMQLHAENELLVESNIILSEQNNILEESIQSKQQNDIHAEKFAREELNLIYKNEDFLSFEEKKIHEPQ